MANNTPQPECLAVIKGAHCGATLYARGLCQGHYAQSRRAGFSGTFTEVRKREDEKLVQVLVRIRPSTHRQLLLAAAEEAVSPYAKHQALLDSWAERREARLRGETASPVGTTGRRS